MDFDADVISATGAVMSLAEACRPNAPNIALYFSSSESAPCKAFSPLLARALVAPDGCLCDTDVLLVSSDVTEEAFHASREGFMALPFPASAAREALIDKYNIQAVPMLVIVRRSDGAVVSSTAREAVEACGGVRPVGASPSWRATTTVAWYFVFLSMLAAAMLVSPIGDAVPFMRGSMPSHHLVEKRLFSDDLVGSALDGKLVIVTGANSGVGLGTSRMLAKHNASVVLACRDVRKCEAVRAALPYMARHACLRLDLASLQDVKRFAGEVRARFPKVHGVVLNAGVMFPEFGLTVDGLETTWGVDYVAHVLLTLELAPMLRNGSTVVSVSSNGHFFPSFDPHVGHPERFNDPEVFSRLMQYGRAKLGNIFLARALAPRLAAQGVTINALHPGGVRSAISRHLPALVYWQARFTQEVLFWTEDEAALTVVGAVVNPHGRTGTYFVPVLREDLGSAQSQNLSLAQAWVAHTEAWLAEHVA